MKPAEPPGDTLKQLDNIVQPAKSDPSDDQALPHSFVASADNPCHGINITGPLTVPEFKQFFKCLNRAHALDSLQSVIVQDTANVDLFVSLYNQTFEINTETKTKSIRVLNQIKSNGDLDELFAFVATLIEEFIDAPEFKSQIVPLLSDVLSDDLDLLTLLRQVVDHEHADTLFSIIEQFFQRDVLRSYLDGLGSYLRTSDDNNVSGASRLVSAMNAIFELDDHDVTNIPFSVEDVFQLHTSYVARDFLEILFEFQTNKQIPLLVTHLHDLLTHQTTSVLAQERIDALKRNDPSLTDAQKLASEMVLKKHPANDLATLIKLAGSLHRPFMAEDRPGQNQNLLASMNQFLNSVKAAFDIKKTLGLDATATERITVYSLYVNLAYQELSDETFHALSASDKLAAYTEEIELDEDEDEEDLEDMPQPPYSSHFRKHVHDYKLLKLTKHLDDYEKALREETNPDDSARWSGQEIAAKRYVESLRYPGSDELKAVLNIYRQKLMPLIEKAIYDLNTQTVLFYATPYDLLKDLQDAKSIGVFMTQVLPTLKIEALDDFLDQLVNGMLKDFFKYNKPIDNAMRELDKDDSGAAWLSNSIDLLHQFEKGMPKKDQITIAAVIESSQVLERLLITENWLPIIKTLLVPLIDAIEARHQEDRVLRLIQFLHTGSFDIDIEGYHREDFQIINRLSPILLDWSSSGFLKMNLDLLASLGKDADPFNRFIQFLLVPQSKRNFVDKLYEVAQDTDSLEIRNRIEAWSIKLDGAADLPPLLNEIDALSNDTKTSLIPLAQAILINLGNEANANRLISDLLNTARNLSENHSAALTSSLLHFGNFLTMTHVNQFLQFIDGFNAARKTQGFSSGSFLTDLIKQDEMEQFLELAQRMIETNTFESSHRLFKDLIQTGKLTQTIDLLSQMLLQGEAQ